jgi:hypothetical protein
MPTDADQCRNHHYKVGDLVCLGRYEDYEPLIVVDVLSGGETPIYMLWSSSRSNALVVMHIDLQLYGA